MDGREQSYWWGIQSALEDALELLKQVRLADGNGYRPSELIKNKLPLGDIKEPLGEKIDDFIKTHDDD